MYGGNNNWLIDLHLGIVKSNFRGVRSYFFVCLKGVS